MSAASLAFFNKTGRWALLWRKSEGAETRSRFAILRSDSPYSSAWLIFLSFARGSLQIVQVCGIVRRPRSQFSVLPFLGHHLTCLTRLTRAPQQENVRKGEYLYKT